MALSKLHEPKCHKTQQTNQISSSEHSSSRFYLKEFLIPNYSVQHYSFVSTYLNSSKYRNLL